MYDIDEDEYVNSISYPDDFQPSAHGIAVDSNEHTIYFCFENPNEVEYYFASYNILSKEWDIYRYPSGDNFCGDWNFPRVQMIDSFMCFRSRSIAGQRLVKYSPESRECIDLATHFTAEKVQYSALCYDTQNRKIMLCGGYRDQDGDIDEIWTYDIDQDDDDGTWELDSAKMPYATDSNYNLVTGFDSILFVLYMNAVGKKEIWCLELISKQWFKSHVNFPPELCNCDLVKADDNHIYLMNYTRINVRINLYDIIPVELMQFYSKYYAPLVNGYIRMEYEQRNEHMHISQDLKQLIAKYFNAFL